MSPKYNTNSKVADNAAQMYKNMQIKYDILKRNKFVTHTYCMCAIQ